MRSIIIQKQLQITEEQTKTEEIKGVLLRTKKVSKSEGAGLNEFIRCRYVCECFLTFLCVGVRVASRCRGKYQEAASYRRFRSLLPSIHSSSNFCSFPFLSPPSLSSLSPERSGEVLHRLAMEWETHRLSFIQQLRDRRLALHRRSEAAAIRITEIREMNEEMNRIKVSRERRRYVEAEVVRY